VWVLQDGTTGTWTDVEPNSIEVVTDVACDDGDIVGTKETISGYFTIQQ